MAQADNPTRQSQRVLLPLRGVRGRVIRRLACGLMPAHRLIVVADEATGLWVTAFEVEAIALPAPCAGPRLATIDGRLVA